MSRAETHKMWRRCHSCWERVRQRQRYRIGCCVYDSRAVWLVSEPAGSPSTRRQASSPRSPGPPWTQRSGLNTTFTSRLKIRRGSTAWRKSSSPSSTWTTTRRNLMNNSWKRRWLLAHLSEWRYCPLKHLPLALNIKTLIKVAEVQNCRYWNEIESWDLLNCHWCEHHHNISRFNYHVLKLTITAKTWG